MQLKFGLAWKLWLGRTFILNLPEVIFKDQGWKPTLQKRYCSRTEEKQGRSAKEECKAKAYDNKAMAAVFVYQQRP